MADQHGGASEIRHVGMRLLGEHRVAVQTLFLRPLDLGVPVGALDEAHHETQPGVAANAGHGVNYLDGAHLIGLYGKSEAAPLRMADGDTVGQRREDIEGQLEPVALLGVDGEIDVGLRGQIDQGLHARHEFVEHATALRFLVTREQRAQLDGDAVRAFGAARTGRICPASPAAAGQIDGADRRRIRRQVALRVGFGSRAFAEHVVAEAQTGPAASRIVGCRERFVDRTAEHELAGQQLDGAHRRCHHGLRAEPAQQPCIGFGIGKKAFGQGDGARRQIGDAPMRRRRALFSGSRREVGASELIGGQRHRRLRIGHAQQGFGEAHQGQPLAARDRVLLQQRFEREKRRWPGSDGRDPGPRHGNNGPPVERLLRRRAERFKHCGFGAIRRWQPGLRPLWYRCRHVGSVHGANPPAGGRSPKMALPMRTIVAPSAMAASRSALMPIDKVSSVVKPFC